MKKLLILSILVLFAFGLNAFAQNAKITAVRAQLYYRTDGTFSEDMLVAKDLSLWNTIIGEGWAGKPSNSTLVTVEVTGKNLPIGKVKLNITATGDKNRVMGKTLVDVDIYDDQTKFYAGLWLDKTGCEKVKITSRLIGVPKATVVTKTIPFNCGE